MGVSIFIQYWIQDPQGVAGYTAGNGLQFTNDFETVGVLVGRQSVEMVAVFGVRGCRLELLAPGPDDLIPSQSCPRYHHHEMAQGESRRAIAISTPRAYSCASVESSTRCATSAYPIAA